MWNLIISISCSGVLGLLRMIIKDDSVLIPVSCAWLGICFMALVNGIIELIKQSRK